MANPWAAKAFGASTTFSEPQDVYEFRPSQILGYYRFGDGFDGGYDPVVQASFVCKSGSMITTYPHAGILNPTSFLRRYPTAATNRNRARARWTYYHFLGLDVEKSASRWQAGIGPVVQRPWQFAAGRGQESAKDGITRLMARGRRRFATAQ